MTPCTITPTVTATRAARILEWVARYFSQSVVTREAVDQAWIDFGLGRLSRTTLEDIGAPPRLVDRAEQNEAWKIASALDSTRLL